MMPTTSPFPALRLAPWLVMAAMLTGCAAVPDLGPLPARHDTGTLASSNSLGGSAQNWVSQQWWQQYGDAQLDQLMSEALSAAPDMAAAQARLERAQGYAQQAGASLLPGAGLSIDITRLKQSDNNGTPRAFVPEGFNNASRVALDFRYELDFWGKNRSALAAATSELAAAAAESAQSRLLLSTALAASYAELARLFAEQDAAAQALQVRRHSLQLLNDRLQQGLETPAAVRQAESRQAAAAADMLAAEEAIALQRNALAALSGAGPDRGLRIARPAAGIGRAQALPATLQAELLGRRPDLVAARLRADAAASRIHVARAGFYPNVNLSAYIGGQSLGLGLLDKAGSGIAGIGPAISLPLFQGGQLQGNYRVARADYDSAVASYNQTLTQALHEVADAFTRQQRLAPQLQLRRQALDAAEQAHRIAGDRYRGGLANYLEVLNAEDNVIASRRILANLQSQQFSQDIALIKALGGDYQAI